MRLAEALNAAAFLINEHEHLFTCSSARRCNKPPHLTGAFNISREENEPGGPCPGKERRLVRAEIRAR
jgi:hypothetical protein